MEFLGFLVGKVQHGVGLYADGIPKLLAAYAITLGILASLCVFEVLYLGWKKSSLYAIGAHWGSARTDVLSHFLNKLGVLFLVGNIFLLALPYVLIKIVRPHITWLHPIAIESPLLVVLIYYIASDFVYYWFHRLCHTVPALWAFHRYHHSAPAMTMLSGDRGHPLEAALLPVFRFLPMLLLPVPTEYAIATQIVVTAQGYLKHSNIKSYWGVVGRYILVSPGSHWIHHSINPAHYTKNFADQFMFWDLLFGSACYDPPEKIGLADDSGNAPPLRYIWSVYLDFAGEALRVNGRIARLIRLAIVGA